jgi:hypothetical protein
MLAEERSNHHELFHIRQVLGAVRNVIAEGEDFTVSPTRGSVCKGGHGAGKHREQR